MTRGSCPGIVFGVPMKLKIKKKVIVSRPSLKRRAPLKSGKVTPITKGRVVVGMSGGVDSSVAAALLKKDGYDVTGVFMKNWADPRYPCPWEEDRRDAMRVAAILDIPFETWDFTREYREAVVSYMIREYTAGRTPNPDVMCNREIKFGIFLKRALERGVDFVATGHYVIKHEAGNMKQKQYVSGSKFQASGDASSFTLHAARDLNKDQSYFLWTLTQEQLKHALFPIGEYEKPEVRKLAEMFGLPTAEKPDSQGVCFIGELDVNAFLHDHIASRPGRVVTSSGRDIGEHDGVEFYTIGQRHGINIGGGIPYYVSAKDALTNTLVVAEGPNDDTLFRKELTAEEIHWISGDPPAGGLPFECEARIRYRQPLQHCRVEGIRNKELGKRPEGIIPNSKFLLRVVFDEEQRAVTPGQSIVFYQDGVMLGGGIIA